MFALKDLMTRLGSKNLDAGQDGAALNPASGRATYLFNGAIAGIDKADALLIVGSNPRKEAPVLNARIRKRWRTGKLAVAVIGEKTDLTYPYDYLGAGPETLKFTIPALQQILSKDATIEWIGSLEGLMQGEQQYPIALRSQFRGGGDGIVPIADDEREAFVQFLRDPVGELGVKIVIGVLVPRHLGARDRADGALVVVHAVDQLVVLVVTTTIDGDG